MTKTISSTASAIALAAILIVALSANARAPITAKGSTNKPLPASLSVSQENCRAAVDSLRVVLEQGPAISELWPDSLRSSLFSTETTTTCIRNNALIQSTKKPHSHPIRTIWHDDSTKILSLSFMATPAQNRADTLAADLMITLKIAIHGDTATTATKAHIRTTRALFKTKPNKDVVDKSEKPMKSEPSIHAPAPSSTAKPGTVHQAPPPPVEPPLPPPAQPNDGQIEE